MRTTSDGSVLNSSQVYDYEGIYRHPDCEFMASWKGYKCKGKPYGMFIFENMDQDSIKRRISPIGLLSIDSKNRKYLDLLNGPKNLGWCGHYSCLERLSTYFAIVAQNITYQLSFTGSSPQSMRFFNHRADEHDSIHLVIDWITAQRLDIYVDSNYIAPESRIPSIELQVGANFFDTKSQQLHLNLKGPRPILVVTSPVITISLSLSFANADDFFDSGKLIINLASYLNIPSTDIKIASSNQVKKRDGVSGVYIIQIGSPPPDSYEPPVFNTTVMKVAPNVTILSTFESALPYYNEAVSRVQHLINISSNLVDSIQLGKLKIPNVEINTLSLTLPSPPSLPYQETAESNSSVSITYFVPFSGNRAFQVPSQLQIRDSINSTYYNQLPTFHIFLVDLNKNLVENLGVNSLWSVKVSLIYKENDAKLGGSLEKSFVNGSATFENLNISRYNQSYSLMFTPYVNNIPVQTFALKTPSFLYIQGSASLETPAQASSSATVVNAGLISGIVISVIAVIAIVGSTLVIRNRKRSQSVPMEKNSPSIEAPLPDQSKPIEAKEKQIVDNSIPAKLYKDTGPNYAQYFQVTESYNSNAQQNNPNVAKSTESIDEGDIIHVTTPSVDKQWFVGKSLQKNKV